MIKQFKDEPVTTWEPGDIPVTFIDGKPFIVTTNIPPACAACEKLPKKDCPNPSCAFRGTEFARF